MTSGPSARRARSEPAGGPAGTAPVTVERYVDLAARVRVGPRSTPTTRVVMVDGPSGAGKSTFAERLAGRLLAPLVHMDHLYPGWDGLAEAVPILVGWVLEPLRAGRPARYRRWDWQRNEYAEWHGVPSTPTLVVEGAGSGARAAAAYATLLVWVEAPRDLRLRRGLERDGEAYRPHWQRWARQEEAMFAAERTRERADVRVDGGPAVPHDPATEYVRLP